MKYLIFLGIFIPLSLCLTNSAQMGMESHTGRQLIFSIESRMSCVYEPLEIGTFLKLSVKPYPLIKSRFPFQMRLTSPSGEFSEWANGEGDVRLRHNVTETGDYEICLISNRPYQIVLDIFFQNPEKVEKELMVFLEKQQLNRNIYRTLQQLFSFSYNILHSIKYYNMASFGDEKMVMKNMEYIQIYSISFCVVSIVVAIINVCIIRRMFRVDTKRIRI